MEREEGRSRRLLQLGYVSFFLVRSFPYVGKCLPTLVLSGHDIAHEFYNTGAAEVTMVQRSSTLVISSEKGVSKLLDGAGYYEGGPPTEVRTSRVFFYGPSMIALAGS